MLLLSTQLNCGVGLSLIKRDALYAVNGRDLPGLAEVRVQMVMVSKGGGSVIRSFLSEGGCSASLCSLERSTNG